MLPATTRKSLRIPHHFAILAAGVSLALAFWADLYDGHTEHAISLTQVSSESNQTAQTAQTATSPAVEQAPTEATARTRVRFDLPRLLPWAKPQPRSE